jgi:DNA gyrase/topoisomerase IV subunit A
MQNSNKDLIDPATGRRIPKLTDGMKPSMHRILSAVLRQHRAVRSANAIKVAELASSMADDETMVYHHGEADLADAITRMSIVDLPGASVGTFGTRSG